MEKTRKQAWVELQAQVTQSRFAMFSLGPGENVSNISIGFVWYYHNQWLSLSFGR